MNLIKYIAKALQPISEREIDVFEGWYDESLNKTHISIKILYDNPNEITDDEIESIVHMIQINIWSKRKELKLKNEVMDLMLNNDFGYIESSNDFEKSSKTYIQAMRFVFVEEL